MIVLDTHAWLWWMAAPERLSGPARKAIERAVDIGVSTLSAWEVATLSSRGRIALDRDVELWVRKALAEPRVEALPPSPEIAVAAGLLDARRFPGDPVDRLIYSTAKVHSAVLVTRDAGIREYDASATIW